MANGEEEYKRVSDYRFHPKTEFRIEAPPKGRHAFRIRYKAPDGKWTTINLPEIEAANRLFLEQIIDKDGTKASLKKVLAALYQQRDKYAPEPEMLTKNIKLVDLVMEEMYPPSRMKRLVAQKNPREEMLRATKALGTKFPLATCDLEELDGYLHEKFEDNLRKLYRTITWLNVMLRHLGRKQLTQVDPEKPQVKYITEEEFVTQVLPLCDNALDRALYGIAFYTGLRLGEIFYLEHHHVKKHTLWIEGQMAEKGGKLVRRLKRGTEAHDAILPADARPYLEKWLEVTMETRRKVRQRKHAERLRLLCMKAFPKNRMKHLTFHCLRHSNAIWLLENTEMKLFEVAQHLGNSAAVVELYYSGYQLKKGTIDRVANQLDKRDKSW